MRSIQASRLARIATDEQVATRTTRRRLFQLTLIAPLVLQLLALVGIDGVLSCTTAQVLREMGIRLAGRNALRWCSVVNNL